VKVVARQRPRGRRDRDCELGDRAKARVGPARGEAVRIVDRGAGERFVLACYTQKLCVTGRSIQTLVEARRDRIDELALRP
jgi:hypothetical protein